MIHTLHINPLSVIDIRNRLKTLDARAAFASLKIARAGDQVRFISRTAGGVVCDIFDVRQYEDFKTMLENEDSKKIIPTFDKEGVLSLLQAVYPPEVERLGAVVLELRLN